MDTEEVVSFQVVHRVGADILSEQLYCFHKGHFLPACHLLMPAET